MTFLKIKKFDVKKLIPKISAEFTFVLTWPLQVLGLKGSRCAPGNSSKCKKDMQNFCRNYNPGHNILAKIYWYPFPLYLKWSPNHLRYSERANLRWVQERKIEQFFPEKISFLPQYFMLLYIKKILPLIHLLKIRDWWTWLQ